MIRLARHGVLVGKGTGVFNSFHLQANETSVYCNRALVAELRRGLFLNAGGHSRTVCFASKQDGPFELINTLPPFNFNLWPVPSLPWAAPTSTPASVTIICTSKTDL